MDTLWQYVERLLSAIAMTALAALVLLPATQVFLRDVFSAPIIGLEEATRWSLIILVFAAAPLLISTNQQIRLAEFTLLLPAGVRNLLERITLLAGGIVLGIIAWSGLLSILRNSGTRTPTLDIPFWLFALPMLAGFGLAAIGYVWFALRRAAPPVGGEGQIT
ncbi:TRAP-type C4-dicarboxylate transport system permease small subunit [Tepidamorphus gemmatus]|uniref:TRAP transporter small permease protein n=1 Tax=Tepidamorphus gemmatus TaxID=747076 RepID=A0A4R3MEE0_9HYPH|nr:TRAP transporter small permease subunit [Tepidamorphus gemmatus]TCT10547.1 TRAP-type C4-dicarboxylate transport system permease small subunit [Tepidamorphus gemmatus]